MKTWFQVFHCFRSMLASYWNCEGDIIIINPILVQVYPHKWGWLDLPHSNSNLSNSYSPSCSIQGILFLQTNTLALLLHFYLPCLLWSSSLPLALHFKLQHFSQNMPIIPPQQMPYHISLHSPLLQKLEQYGSK